MAAYDLGPLTGGPFHQYASAVGQPYYYNTITKITSYALPPGYEDSPSDTWTRNTSKPWPQWDNNRTGRATLIDPNPPPPKTYLENDNVQAALDMILKVPESDEHIYRRPLGAILRFIFPPNEGFDVVQEAVGENSCSDFCVFKVFRKPGGTLYQYEFLLAESKTAGMPWGATEDQHHEQLAGNGNDSKNCYGLIQIGLHVQYYKYENRTFSKIGEKMHLITHADAIVSLGRHIRNNPLPLL